MQSEICEPPKPRLMTRYCGKSCGTDFHMRMLELPTNSMACLGAGFVLSLASKARISFSKALVLVWASVEVAAKSSARRWSGILMTRGYPSTKTAQDLASVCFPIARKLAEPRMQPWQNFVRSQFHSHRGPVPLPDGAVTCDSGFPLGDSAE